MIHSEAQNIAIRRTVRDPANQQSPVDLLEYHGDRLKALPKTPKTTTAPAVLTHYTFSGQVDWSSVGGTTLYIPHGPLTGTFCLSSLWFHQWSAVANTFSFALSICDVPARTFAAFDAGSRFFPNTIFPGMANIVTCVADSIVIPTLTHTLRLYQQYVVLMLTTNTPILSGPWTNYAIALTEV